MSTGGRYFLWPLKMYQIVAKSVMPPNMAIFQFIVVASTGVAVGKRQKTKNVKRNPSAIALLIKPQRPSVKADRGSGSRRSRFRKMQPIESIYELSNADMVRETIALRATLEPRLIREMATPHPKETTTALRGTFHPGLTYYQSASLYSKDNLAPGQDRNIAT